MPADSILIGAKLLSWMLSWGATYFIHSTCLIAGIWLFVRHRHAASQALREILWKTALVGGIVTTSVQTWLTPISPLVNLTLKLEPFSLPPTSSEFAPAARTSSRMEGFGAAQRPVSTRHEEAGESLPADQSAADNSIHDSRIVVIEPETELTGISFESGRSPVAADQMFAPTNDRSALSLWINKIGARLPAVYAITILAALLAILVGLARCAWQTISLRRKLARCRAIQGGPARALLDELLRLVPRKPKVRLLSSPDESEPAAFGVSRWTIVLPPRAAFDLTEDELRALLAHELAHLVRGDSLWLSISRAVCSCLAFQPLNHLARREWQRTAEFLCDNWAVSRTGAPLALARCLTEVAGWRLAGPASAAILAATGRKSGLVDRIERLLDARPVFELRNDLRVRRQTVFAGTLLLATLACGAPRVQLIAAAPGDRAHIAAPSRSQDSATALPAQESADAGLAEPEADEGQQVSDDELQNEAIQPPRPGAAQRTPDDAASLWESLDRDLLALENELEQLGPLLKENAAPQAEALAKKLRREIVRLQHRREVLKALSRKSVK